MAKARWQGAWAALLAVPMGAGAAAETQGERYVELFWSPKNGVLEYQVVPPAKGAAASDSRFEFNIRHRQLDSRPGAMEDSRLTVNCMPWSLKLEPLPGAKASAQPLPAEQTRALAAALQTFGTVACQHRVRGLPGEGQGAQDLYFKADSLFALFYRRNGARVVSPGRVAAMVQQAKPIGSAMVTMTPDGKPFDGRHALWLLDCKTGKGAVPWEQGYVVRDGKPVPVFEQGDRKLLAAGASFDKIDAGTLQSPPSGGVNEQFTTAVCRAVQDRAFRETLPLLAPITP